LRQIAAWPISADGIAKRRNVILYTLEIRSPILIGSIAMSKITGIVMAMRNMEHFVREHPYQVREGTAVQSYF